MGRYVAMKGQKQFCGAVVTTKKKEQNGLKKTFLGYNMMTTYLFYNMM